MCIYTTETIMEAVMNTKHCSKNFKYYSPQISLFLYIYFFGPIALTPLETSTSLTPHYAAPMNTRTLHSSAVITDSLQRDPLTRSDTKLPLAVIILSLVSVRITALQPMPLL